MDGVLFEEWVREINAELKTKVRKIALIIDNCPVHPEIENISLPKLIFLPPYTTLVIQPMDQGIIRSLKVHYRKRVVRVILTHLDQGNPIPKISLLKAMQLLASTWNDVSKETVNNCFRKVNISEIDQMKTVNDIDAPLKEFERKFEGTADERSISCT